ncbi:MULTISPECIES: energy-coupling factor ABC transporter permease [Thermococcus]|uniref:ABC-type Co2+ transport system, permease component n=1 Tax=Thermococcus nautili TaxID=195522 RepID=W8PI68_9EURY|nr:MULTISPECIES: energy-coupling factor ABC transporter permease [Thermococcus]AHL21799.1 ABC-type Co2+ transport system, permease component [Thermococcus nautili]NJE48960.1 cobalamin biosynthesis protein [Thermococcus sp. 9N3]
MHIPDGLLSTPIIIVTYAITILGVAYSARKLRNLPEEKIPLLGLFAAGIFAAQMVNFPIIGGVSGHLLGATLVAILLGPYASVIVMTAVLLIQTLLFGDGGITAIGANILNMGLVGAFIGYGVYLKLRNINETLAMGFASWLSVVLGATLASIEIGLSHSLPFTKVLALMVGYHSIIGIGEAVLTVLIVNALRAKLPSLEGVPA